MRGKGVKPNTRGEKERKARVGQEKGSEGRVVKTARGENKGKGVRVNARVRERTLLYRTFIHGGKGSSGQRWAS